MIGLLHPSTQRPDLFPDRRFDRWRLGYWVSLLLAVSVGLLCFTSPRVLFRVVVPVGGFDIIAALFFSGLLAGLAALAFFVFAQNRTRLVLAQLLFFVLATIVLYRAGGVPFSLIVQYLPGWVGVMAYTALGMRPTVLRHLLFALTGAMLLHTFAIYSPFEYFRNAISIQTRADLVLYFKEIGDYGSRATGFNAAPGHLSFLSVISVGAATMLLLRERCLIWIVLLVCGFACGFATANRSFILGLVFVAASIPIIDLFLRRKFTTILYTAMGLAVIGTTLFVVWQTTEYGRRMDLRFREDIVEEHLYDRLYGEAGQLRAWQVFLQYPIFGNAQVDPYSGNVRVSDGQNTYRPHNGLAQIFASRGIFIGGLMLVWIVVGTLNLFRVVLRYSPTAQATFATAILAAAAGGHAVALVDSFTDKFPLLVLTMLGFVAHPKHFGIPARGPALSAPPRVRSPGPVWRPLPPAMPASPVSRPLARN